ncbi:MAG: prephenate dehydratase [Methanosarcinaceae archaeon]|nr:prephenate dehydratase [Methanosarcinaceae archaeon]
MIIGVLGPEGSYSEKAAKLWIRDKGFKTVSLRYFEDIEDAFTAAAKGKADFSVIPVENSIEGSVGISLDLLLRLKTVICGEIVIRIEHSLLSKGGRENIKVILSHPQALAQCRHFLKENFPDAEIRSTGSTSHAALLAGEFEEMAAISAPEAAKKYGLKILLSNIQDRKENHTRFLVIRPGNFHENARVPENCPHEKTDPDSEGASSFKTSLIVYIAKDRPGSLYELLGAFAKRGINLTKIESRPSKRELGDYYFYIDFEGHIGDAVIKDALKDIKTNTDMLKVLGSYPRFEKN